MTIRRAMLRLTVASALAIVCCGADALAQNKPSGAGLPKPSEIPGVEPDVLLRAEVPNVPGKVLIVSRTTYLPSAHVAMHYHTSQSVFYILQGVMGVRDERKEQITLKAGDSLLIKPGTGLAIGTPVPPRPLSSLNMCSSIRGSAVPSLSSSDLLVNPPLLDRTRWLRRTAKY